MPKNKAPPQCLIYKSHQLNPKQKVYKIMFKHLFVDDISIDYFFPYAELGIIYLELSFHRENRHQLPERLRFTKSQPYGKRGKTVYLALLIDGVHDFEDDVQEISIMVMEHGFHFVICDDWFDFLTFTSGIYHQVQSDLEEF